LDTKIRVWVALGSNLGDSHRILQHAWQELGGEEAIELVILSHPYVTEPVDMESENLFLNAVGILETDLDPESLLALLQRVEKGFGRDKITGVEGYQDRLLDLDILYYDDCVLTASNLVLPHPHIAARLFVLAPLAEIDPEHCGPGSDITAEEMHQDLLLQMVAGRIAFQEIKRDTWV
jgi:2-amino-4-hydroxy-6-hydroxymethyldihydropteridine diphosphokinase